MKFIILNCLYISLFTCIQYKTVAQTGSLSGKIFAENKAINDAQISFKGTNYRTSTDSLGNFTLIEIPNGRFQILVSVMGFNTLEKWINLKEGENLVVDIDLTHFQKTLNEVVVTATLKEVFRSESPVPVELYSPAYFKKNPTPNIFEALQNVNGVRPQLNCNVCNTGDIHINGLEGPYTMVLIDGMPIVSSLSTVYGLSGIPNALIERIEIVKGPASSLYGSEAVGGLINIITIKPNKAPVLTAEIFGTSWGEYNSDLGFKWNAGKNATVLTGINYFHFQHKIDNNKDNFTDMTLQKRVSLFQKWNFQRKGNRLFSIAARFLKEDRWGGDLRFENKFRGGDSIYGESIYTKRWEVLGNYQIPSKEKLMLSFSVNNHEQDSYYGKVSYQAKQNIAFSQMTWDKKLGMNDLLVGAALRYTYYDDNTPATANVEYNIQQNKPENSWLPGLFIQNEMALSKQHKLLLGFRYDYHNYHGHIYTPRVAYKWSINDNHIIRINAGTGFRVVNLFTEDHAALTGARKIEIKNELHPEKSYNFNLNYVSKFYFKNGIFMGIDASLFYTNFNNRIVGDYETDPNKIIYDNLLGFAISKGFSINMDLSFMSGLKMIAGATLMENTLTEKGITKQQILSEKFAGTWAITYKLKQAKISIDYTGNVYSPMRLPLLSSTDPRRAYSPWWSIQNIQLVYDGLKSFQIFGGVKNILNWTPNKGNPFIIARTNDPFDKEVQFGSNGKVIASPNNPYALTFDPNYVYGPNQGIRTFIGVRYRLK